MFTYKEYIKYGGTELVSNRGFDIKELLLLDIQ